MKCKEGLVRSPPEPNKVTSEAWPVSLLMLIPMFHQQDIKQSHLLSDVSIKPQTAGEVRLGSVAQRMSCCLDIHS